MLKFLRKYQKWMLAVFCVGLMVAFLIQPVMGLFMPDPAKRTMATIGGGEKITLEKLGEVSRQLEMIRRLQLDPIPIPGLSLVPRSESERNDALQWLLLQRAAEQNNIGASEQEAFNLLATVLDVQDSAGLEAKADEMGANGAYLIEVAKQFLKAEQYRQLVAGIEYSKPGGTQSQVGSPGIQRVYATSDAINVSRDVSRQLQDMRGMPPEQADMLAMQQVLLQGGYAQKIIGHPRVSADQVRYWLQRQLTEVDLTVILLDAEDRLASVTVSDEDVKSLFERYADDDQGTGEPYGLGYRVPNRVQLEALRIPFDAVREAVAKQINPDDIRAFYEKNKSSFMDFDTPAEDGGFKPKPLTAVLREEIRKTLTHMRTAEKVEKIALAARLRLNEDARGLEDDGSYKKLPKGFKPTPLVKVASEIEADHGVSPEVILIDEWVNGREILDEGIFTQAWLSETPNSFVRLPAPEMPGFLMEQQVRETFLAGRAGLFTARAPEINDDRGQAMTLAQYINQAKPFVKPDSPAAELGLQVGLPGRLVFDLTNNIYVFRLTQAEPSHPATDMTPIADRLEKDALKVKAYEQLVEDEDQFIERAALQPIELLMLKPDDKRTLTAMNREELSRGLPPLPGVTSAAPILQEAFDQAESILASGGLEQADDKDRVFAVELPGDYKLAIVKIDAIRPVSRTVFRQRASNPGIIALASVIDADPNAPSSMTLEALMKATGTTWAEGFDPDSLDADEEQAEDAE